MTDRNESTKRYEAVVAGSRRWRDKDRIVSFLCRDFGRLDAFVFGARKISGRWSGKLEPFSRGEIILRRSKGGAGYSLKEISLEFSRSPSPRPREELSCQAASEMLILTSPGEGTEAEAYDLAVALPHELTASDQPDTVLAAFAFAWSARSGFGAPVPSEDDARRFVECAVDNPPIMWRRYRLRPEQRKRVLILAKSHIEECVERRWRGVELLIQSI